MILCKECRSKPINYKKRSLCNGCYQRLRKNKKLKNIQSLRFREKLFIKNFFNHNEWVREPVSFRLGDTFYTPDFYDGRRNAFIEVVGSRQAYHANKEKYQSLRSRFPKISFEIRTLDGALIEIDKNLRVMWPKEVNG